MAILITEVWGIGNQSAEILAKHGYRSLKDLAETTESELAKVPGFGVIRARKIIASARSLFADQLQTKQLNSSPPKKKKDKKKKEKQKKKKSKKTDKKKKVKKSDQGKENKKKSKKKKK